jgi:predicted transcriptional regulator
MPLCIMSKSPAPATPTPAWTFFSNHAHVLFCIAREPDLRLRDLAQRVGITERGVQRIVAELVDAGFLEVEREGRRNRYEVRGELALRHPIEAHRTVGELIDWLKGPVEQERKPSAAPRATGACRGASALRRG